MTVGAVKLDSEMQQCEEMDIKGNPMEGCTDLADGAATSPPLALPYDDGGIEKVRDRHRVSVVEPSISSIE